MAVFWLHFALKKEHKVIEKVLLPPSGNLCHTFSHIFSTRFFINFGFLAKQRTKGEQYKDMRRRRKKQALPELKHNKLVLS